MKSFKFFWNTHKWTGIALAAFVLLMSVTGFLLLIKKKAAWIQPPLQEAAKGSAEEFITLQQIFAAVLAHGHDDFAAIEDVGRVDIRPRDRVFKVTSAHSDVELQVDAITGAVLSEDVRWSDWIERLHDGSMLGDWVHEWVMPVVSAGLAFLVASGMWLWIEPMVRRRRTRNRRLVGGG